MMVLVSAFENSSHRGLVLVLVFPNMDGKPNQTRLPSTNCADVTRGYQVSGVEVCYLLQGILNVIRIFPGIPFYSITFPFDQVLKLSLEHPAVQDFLYEVFFFAVDEFRRWW